MRCEWSQSHVVDTVYCTGRASCHVSVAVGQFDVAAPSSKTRASWDDVQDEIYDESGELLEKYCARKSI
jgi:hypothetical protein